MKKSKNAYFILIIISLIFCGCSQGEKVQRYAWPLGTASPEDTVTQLFAEKFVEEVARLSEGKMKIQVYANSTLGGDRELLESCKDGDIPFVIQNTAPQVNFMPEVAVFDLPCAFGNMQDVRNAVDKEQFYQSIKEVYKKGGYQLLAYADQGFRVMSTNKQITSFASFKGEKIRTMENKFHLEFWKALHANPTPLSFNEVYIGLQQGTIDAQENPYEVIISSKLYEQQKYIVETNHLPHLISLIVSDEFYKALSDEEQTILSQAANLARDYAREQSDIRISEKKKHIEESGTTIIKLSDELKAEMKRASASIYKQIREQVGESVVNAYLGE